MCTEPSAPEWSPALIYETDIRYVYQGQHIALELENVTDDSYAVDPSTGIADVVKRFMHGERVDEVLPEERDSHWAWWALSDHPGTLRDWVSAENPTHVLHYRYTTFGQLLHEEVTDLELFLGQAGMQGGGRGYLDRRTQDSSQDKLPIRDWLHGYPNRDFSTRRVEQRFQLR